MNCDLCKKEIKTAKDLRFILKSIPDNLSYKNATFFNVHNECYTGIIDYFTNAKVLDESLEESFSIFVKGVFETDEQFI